MPVGTADRTRRLLTIYGLVTSVNIVVSFGYSILYGLSLPQGVKDFFVTLQLIEAGLLFLVGGLISYGGTVFVTKVRQYLLRVDEEWTPQKATEAEKNALLWIVLAVILFTESIILSYLL